MSQVPGLRLGVVAVLIAAAPWGCNNPTEPFEKDLNSLRQATQAFADTVVSKAAGYTVALTPCMADGQLGGMGFHMGNQANINATVELNRPEALLYEPQASGARELVAVEYLVPFDAWTSATPPSLMGQVFKRNEAFGVWALHVWLYRPNPSGTFADWNPRVSCAHAPATSGDLPPHQPPIMRH